MAYIRWQGLQEFREALLALPEDIDVEAERIISGEAAYSVVALRSAYPNRTGDLRKGVSYRRKVTRKGDIVYEFRSMAAIAYIYEWGTEARHYITHNGVQKELGRMPAKHTFWTIYYQRFRVMQLALIAMLKRYGLVVFADAA